MDIPKLNSAEWQATLHKRVAEAGETSRNMAAPVVDSEVSLKDATPSVIYHPSRHEDVHLYQPNAFKPGDPIEIHQQVVRPSKLLDLPVRPLDVIRTEHTAAYRGMDVAYKGFLYQLSKSNPALAGKSFGFSVGQDGSLVVVDAKGLSQGELALLTDKLNQSDQLVSTARRFASLMMEMVEAEENLFFRFHLDLQNFAQTLDLGRALGHAVEYGQHGSTTWVNQMFMKGEVRYGGWIKIYG